MPGTRSLPPHLEIRRAGYYWRRRLPRSLRDRRIHASGAPENKRPKKESFVFRFASGQSRKVREGPRQIQPPRKDREGRRPRGPARQGHCGRRGSWRLPRREGPLLPFWYGSFADAAKVRFPPSPSECRDRPGPDLRHALERRSAASPDRPFATGAKSRAG